MTDAGLSTMRTTGASPWRQELQATFALSWPLVLSSLGTVLMTATDVAMIGQLGPQALASAALGSTLFFVAYIFGVGVFSAVSALLSQDLGANRFAVRDIRRTVRQGLWSAILLSIPCWIVLWHADVLLRWAGQDAQLIPDAAAYTRALMWSLLPGYIVLVFRAFVSALQRPGWALAITAGALVLNAGVNWLLIYGNWGFPALGLLGAGLATTIVSWAMVLAYLLVLRADRQFRRYHLLGRWWRADWPRFRALWRLGLPLGATLLFEVGIFNAAVLLMGLLGATALAAHQIAIQIASVTFMVPMGIGQAVTVRVGWAAGARDADGVTRAAVVALVLGVGFMAAMAIVMVVAPLPFIGLFVDRADPANAAVVALAVQLLMVAALFQVVDGAQAIAVGMLRGLHDTRVPMVLALIGYWGVGFPLGVLLAFPAGLGGVGVWMGLAVGLAVVAVLLLLRWRRRTLLMSGTLGGPRH